MEITETGNIALGAGSLKTRACVLKKLLEKSFLILPSFLGFSVCNCGHSSLISGD